MGHCFQLQSWHLHSQTRNRKVFNARPRLGTPTSMTMLCCQVQPSEKLHLRQVPRWWKLSPSYGILLCTVHRFQLLMHYRLFPLANPDFYHFSYQLTRHHNLHSKKKMQMGNLIQVLIGLRGGKEWGSDLAKEKGIFHAGNLKRKSKWQITRGYFLNKALQMHPEREKAQRLVKFINAG